MNNIVFALEDIHGELICRLDAKSKEEAIREVKAWGCDKVLVICQYRNHMNPRTLTNYINQWKIDFSKL